MADSFQIARERAADGTVTHLRLSGELDINARDALLEVFDQTLADGATDIVVDLGAVTFLDSEALGALIQGYTQAGAHPARFRVVGAHGTVGRVLTVSGALDLFGA